MMKCMHLFWWVWRLLHLLLAWMLLHSGMVLPVLHLPHNNASLSLTSAHLKLPGAGNMRCLRHLLPFVAEVIPAPLISRYADKGGRYQLRTKPW